MSVNVKQSILVRPSKETIPRQSIWLSSLDLILRMPYGHSGSLYVYSPTENGDNTPTNYFDAKVLTDALGKVLISYYPMAGRLKINENDNGRLEIDCNDEGVLFVEGETTNTVADFGDFSPSSELRKLLLPKCDYSKGISTFPLTMIQLTRFKCGGVTLGFALHHHVSDGFSNSNFIKSWARIARELDIDVMPVHERRAYLSPRDPPLVKFQHIFPSPGLLGDSQQIMNLETTTTKVAVFKFSKDQIHTLKQRATSEFINYQPTTYEALAGHIWRSVCQARGLNNGQEVMLYIPTDARGRLKRPALPSGYFGNAIFYTACVMKACDVAKNTSAYVAKKINETLKLMDDEEYIRSTIDYYETHPDLREVVVHGGHPARYPNITINFWGKGMPFYEADFGWGKPMFIGHGGIRNEGQSFITANADGDGGYSLSICLFTHHMAIFPKFLYDMGAKLGSRL